MLDRGDGGGGLGGFVVVEVVDAFDVIGRESVLVASVTEFVSRG